MELVRISTAGNVDDGKSTLIGRLLYDNNALTREQETLVELKTREKGWADLDLSVITDGLTAEREQGITIDVAHIYFSTASRKFIIADSPGHVEYTRNMVTGASTSEISIIVIDARKGLQEQSYRHFFISQLLRLEQVIFCVNKMDLVAYSEDAFLTIAVDIQHMVNELNPGMQYEILPISSLKGDNVVHASAEMPWYHGMTLNNLLHAPRTTCAEDLPFRFDVQHVFHAQREGFVDYRGYAGRILSGSIQAGDSICLLPSGKTTVVTEVRRYTEQLEEAGAGDSVAISIADNFDISRGALFSSPLDVSIASHTIEANLVWMDEEVSSSAKRYVLKAGSREVLTKIQEIHFLIDPIHPKQKSSRKYLEINDLAEVRLRLNQAAYMDSFAMNKRNGIFILIDEQNNATVAVGFVK